ncbi:MAG: PLP-dependent aminotransferase family protein [Polyangiaceae bacterium]
MHRNTVIAAYRELSAEGWIVTRPAGGTFVSAELPDAKPRRFARVAVPRDQVPARVGFEMPPAPPRVEIPPQPAAGTLVFASGLPDVRLAPVAELSRAYRRALRRAGPRLLGYGEPAGEPRLRAALAGLLAEARGLSAAPENVLVTRGSQMAIDLCAKVLLSPGDVVAVEALGYGPAWAALRGSGARLVPVPVDGGGVRADALAARERRERIRALYLTPHHQYPTTVGLLPGRRLQILQMAAEQRIAVLEDDYDNEFHYAGRPVLPLASADRAGVVLYVGTLSKILAPGLRIGFLVAPQPFVERAAALRQVMDRQGDRTVEEAVAEMLEDGEVQRHARRMRGVYAARREALGAALEKHLAGAITFELPQGGMAIWGAVDPSIDVEAWAARGAAAKVAFSTARRFAFDGRARGFVRLGYANLTEREIEDGVKRMQRALVSRKSA